MVWCWMLDNCVAALGQHLLCLEDEQSQQTLDLQKSFDQAVLSVEFPKLCGHFPWLISCARHALRAFLAEFALEFRVSFLQATPKGLLLFVPVLVMNTLGFIADALRLFNAI